MGLFYFLSEEIFNKYCRLLQLIGDVEIYNNNWAATQQNLSSGFLKKRDSNQSPQLQKLARNLKFRL